MNATNTIQDLAELNKFNQNYNFSSVDYFNRDLDLSKEKDYTINKLEKDFAILQNLQKSFLENREENTPKNGDALLLPTGQIVYFCHTWEDRAQTTKGGSYSLFKSGFTSYSGGLDSGVNLKDIYLSDEFATLQIWFPHANDLCANCAIYANILTRVWKTKPGANLRGVPQVAEFYRNQKISKAQTITRVNGNGENYTLPVPRLQFNNLTEIEAKEISKKINCRLFPDLWGNYFAEPLKVSRYEKALKLDGFKSTFNDNGSCKNTQIFSKISD